MMPSSYPRSLQSFGLKVTDVPSTINLLQHGDNSHQSIFVDPGSPGRFDGRVGSAQRLKRDLSCSYKFRTRNASTALWSIAEHGHRRSRLSEVISNDTSSAGTIAQWIRSTDWSVRETVAWLRNIEAADAEAGHAVCATVADVCNAVSVATTNSVSRDTKRTGEGSSPTCSRGQKGRNQFQGRKRRDCCSCSCCLR
jgi:hypothetical protein